MKRHIPNLLTGLRIIMGLTFPWIPVPWRVPVFVLASASEFFDGILARRWNVVTNLGRILDPVADKAFMVPVVGVLLWEGALEWWEVLLMATRDIVVAGASLIVLTSKNREEFDYAEARPLGKWATTFQFVVVLSALLLGFAPWYLVAVTASLSAAAAYDYAAYYFRDVAGRV